jgi:hypothetical protein
MDGWIPPRKRKRNWLTHIPLRFVLLPTHLNRRSPVGLSDKDTEGLRYRGSGIGGNPLATAVAADSLPHDRYQLLRNGRGNRRGQRRVGASAGAANYGSRIHELNNNQNVEKNRNDDEDR